MSSPFPTIPDPGGTLQSIAASVRVIRQSLNIVTANSLPGASGLSKGSQVFATSESLASTSESVAGHSAQINSLSASLKATWGVRVNATGWVVGISLAGSSSIAPFTVEADQFKLIMTGYPATPVMTVANVGGVPALALDGGIIADATILNASIADNAVSNSDGQNSATSIASVTLNVVAGARVGVIATYSGGVALAATGTLAILVNGTQVVSQPLHGVNASGYTLYPSTLVFHYITAGGTDTIEVTAVDGTSAAVAAVSILVFELSK